jgi:hypothetical protein
MNTASILLFLNGLGGGELLLIGLAILLFFGCLMLYLLFNVFYIVF